MNGKKAKSIRRLAEMKTVGCPAVAHKQINDHVKKCGTFTGGDGKEYPNFVNVSQTVLAAGCTRQVYQQLKRAA